MNKFLLFFSLLETLHNSTFKDCSEKVLIAGRFKISPEDPVTSVSVYHVSKQVFFYKSYSYFLQ